MRSFHVVRGGSSIGGILFECAAILPVIMTFGAVILEFGANLNDRAKLTKEASEVARLVSRSAALSSNEAFCNGDAQHPGALNVAQSRLVAVGLVDAHNPQNSPFRSHIQASFSDLSKRWRISVKIERNLESGLSLVRKFTGLASAEVISLAKPEYGPPNPIETWECS